MRAKASWVVIFFLFAAAVLGLMLSSAFRDLFLWLQIDNRAVLGDNLRLSGLIGYSISLILAIIFGIFNKKSRGYIEECVIEFNKVAFPDWSETKKATFTVVMVSIIASIILGIFDTTLSWLMNNNLFIGKF